MGTVKIVNNSTFTDYSAVMRVGRLMAGDEYYATHSEKGETIVNIKKAYGNTYIVTDIQKPSTIEVAKELADICGIDFDSIK